MKPVSPLRSSFRDPAGYLFLDAGTVKRMVTDLGKNGYEKLMVSGLYEQLVRNNWLIPHQESAPSNGDGYKVLVPRQIPVISYPYEWCFSQLKDAALLTLDIQLAALEKGLSLKDATPFNVQFIGPRPVFIDTLSFEEYRERPWVAYRQFCESFLAPLVMMARVRPDFNRYLKADLDGFDLALCQRTLPLSTWLDPGILTHIHLHAMSQAKFKSGRLGSARLDLSKRSLTGLIRHLRSTVSDLKLKKQKTVWGDYYADQRHYSAQAEESKTQTVAQWLKIDDPRLVLDLGANTGKFSRLASQAGAYCVSADIDISCVEQNYNESKSRQDERMLPLLADLSNPSGGLGWQSREREPLFERVRPDLTLALALIHHLRITHNVPLTFLADFFSQHTRNLLLEFVPKEDPMVQRLLQNREDIFHDYHQDNFEKCFGVHFTIHQKTPLAQTERTLYYLRAKG